MTNMVSALVDVVFAAAPGEQLGPVGQVIKFFKDGGPFMFVNLFWLACALGVAAERFYTLLFRYNLNAAPFMQQIQTLVGNGNVDRALKLCRAVPNAPLAKVVGAGLSRANRGEMEVAKAVEESIVEHTPAVTARVAWLWSLANIATLVGLVGTVFGLIGTFRALGDVPADQKQLMLSEGISKAMNNTAFALSIAVLCIIFHLILTSLSKGLVETVELYAMKLENLLSRRSAGEVAPATLDEKSA